jgi:hypothetical protein
MSRKFDPSTALYDGRDCIGFIVVESKGRWTAYDHERRCLGEYASRDDAIAALRGSDERQESLLG